jgi:hypothetical protein
MIGVDVEGLSAVKAGSNPMRRADMPTLRDLRKRRDLIWLVGIGQDGYHFFGSVGASSVVAA